MARQAVFHFLERTEVRYLEVMPDAGEIFLSAGVAWVVTSVEAQDEHQFSCTLVPEEKSRKGRDTPASSSTAFRARPHEV